MDRAGFDANSLTREYAIRVMKSELPLPPLEDKNARIVPLDEVTVVTAVDFQKMILAAAPEFRNSKEAN